MAQLRAAHGLIEQLPRRTFLALPPSWLSTGVVRDLHGPPPVEEYDDVPKYPQLSPHKTEKETLVRLRGFVRFRIMFECPFSSAA